MRGEVHGTGTATKAQVRIGAWERSQREMRGRVHGQEVNTPVVDKSDSTC